MSKVKQVLAGVLSASMIVTLMPAVTFAEEPTPGSESGTSSEATETTTPSEVMDATITITNGSQTYPYTVDTDAKFRAAIANAQPGDTIDIDGDVVLSESNAALTAAQLAADKATTVDLTGATFYGEYGFTIPAENATAGAISAYQPTAGVDVYSFTLNQYNSDGSNMVINFPQEYDEGTTHGVTVNFTMANGQTYTAVPNTAEPVPALNGYSLCIGDYKVKNEMNRGFTLATSTTGSIAPTCLNGGEEVVNAVVKTPTAATGYDQYNPFEESYDYGEISALGHKYAESANIVNGVIRLPEYKLATGYNNDYAGFGIQIVWGIRGLDNSISVAKDGDYTAISSVKTVCLRDEDTHGSAHALADATSYRITGATPGTPASSAAVGSTVYTLEIVTADGVTVTAQQTVWDVPALDATTVGVIKGITFETYEYTYAGGTTDTFTKSSDKAVWKSTLYPDYTFVKADGKWYKTEFTTAGDVNYRITYLDALSGDEGTLTGTLTATNESSSKKTAIYDCGVNTYYYAPVTVNAATGVAGEGVTLRVSGSANIAVGATTADGATAPTNDKTYTSYDNTAVNTNNYFKLSVPGNVEGTSASPVYNYKKLEGSGADAFLILPGETPGEDTVYAYTASHNHTLDMNDGTWTEIKPATTTTKGIAQITCKDCGKVVYVELPYSTTNVSYAKVAAPAGEGWVEGELTTDVAQAWTFTKDPTCTEGGYDYRLVATVGGTVANSREEKISGTDTPATGHDFYLAPADVTWSHLDSATGNDVTAKAEYRCKNEKNAVMKEITYYAAKGTDTEVTDPATGKITATVHEAITSEIVKGADCTKANQKVYTVKDVTDLFGNAIQGVGTYTLDGNVPGYGYGDHQFVNTVNWAIDGKSATATRTCALGKDCRLHNGDKGYSTVVTAEVGTPVVNADGSYTYTATYGNEVLGTKTVFDLADAVITINNGETIDANAYVTPAMLKAAIEADGAVSVTIKDIEIDPSLYDVTATVTGETSSAVTALAVKVEAATDVENVVNTKTKTLKKNDTNAQLVVNKMFQEPVVTFDGIKKGATGYDADIMYDAEAHAATATPRYENKDVEATVKYAVFDGALAVNDLSDEETDPTYDYSISYETLYGPKTIKASELVFDLDSVELTDAGDYAVFALITKDGYTDRIFCLDTDIYTIEALPIGRDITLSKQIISYGEQLTATTGDAEIDELIGLTVLDTTKLGVGTYTTTNYVIWDTNFDVEPDEYHKSFTVQQRNATIVMTEGSSTYTGLPVDLANLFTIDGLVEGDHIDVVVNSAGNQGLVDAGTYTLVATANNSNYKIEKVTATYTINPASIAKATVTLAKTSMKYTGKALKPAVKSVVLDGETLAASNYTVKYANNKNVGTATVTVTGKGNYTGSAKATFKITKAANTLKVTAVKRTAKAATLKTKAVTVAGIKVTGAQGKVTYRKAKGGSKFTVNKTTGKITIKKGVKAGTYKVTESAQAAGNSNYKKSKVKKAVVTITVK